MQTRLITCAWMYDNPHTTFCPSLLPTLKMMEAIPATTPIVEVRSITNIPIRDGPLLPPPMAPPKTSY